MTREKLTSPLLALQRMQKGATSPRSVQAAWRGWKGKKGPHTDPTDMNAATDISVLVW